MPNVQRLLEKRVEAAIVAAFPEAGQTPALLAPAQDARFGDYQANGAMALAKRLGKKPREVAEQIVKRLDVSDLAETPEVAGPGFINLRLKPEWVGAQLGEISQVRGDDEDRLGVKSADRPETVVVDYSAPNLAKEMHVGHLRSTIIGDALVRMLDFAGHTVVRQNHVGDWGTQFGMLAAYLKTTDIEREGDLGVIEKLYRMAKTWFDSKPENADLARKAVVALQAGDPAMRQAWQTLRKMTIEHCNAIYLKLRVSLRPEHVRGESDYNDDLPGIVEALRAKGLLTESDGAQCVFLKDKNGKPIFVNKEGEPLPLIVQKRDEGYLYATTDLAAIRYRVNVLKANRILYVVDARQALHFKMVFEAARQAAFVSRDFPLIHVAFGTMMGADGRPFKTREGDTVKLMDLLEMAIKKSSAVVSQRQSEDVESGRAPLLSKHDRYFIAQDVGIGAVKYADLAQNRTSDYVFSWEKMLSLAGNTAPYMQYAYARVRSIFRKGEHEAEAHRADVGPLPLEAPEELALGKMLLRFPETLERALDGYQPNVVAAYLYDLAQAFTAFYEACPVLKSEPAVRRARLRLCDLVARTIAKGLSLLGIAVADRM